MNPRTRRRIVTAVLVLVMAAVVIGALFGGGADMGETLSGWAQ